LDPLTHLLTGACLGRAGFNRTSGLATAVLTIAAEAPDMDMVGELGGPVFGFQHHRGLTHTFLGVPLDAAVALGVVYLWYRFRLRRGGKPAKLAPRWALLFGYALVGALSHILLDYTNSYGVRPFMPFSYRWYHWDIMSLTEPLMLLALVAGLVVPSLFRLIQEEIGARRGGGRASAIAALVIVALVWGVRDYEHRRTVAALDSLLYQGVEPLRVSAFPYAFNPFAWHGVVEAETFYETVPVNSLGPEVDPQRRARVYYKPEETPAQEAAERTQLGRVFLDWADYPLVEVQREPSGEYRVQFVDLRYRYPGRSDLLSPTMQMDANFNVLWIRMSGLMLRMQQPPSRPSP